LARQSAYAVENNFTKGLITEATGLNFPENAATETYDCVFSEKGRATRRLGFEYEGAFETATVNRTDGAIVEYVWTAAGSSGNVDIVVVQVGATLYYYTAEESDSLSASIIADTTNLLTFEVGVATDVKGTPCQFASGEGYLFVVHPLCEPFYVSYDPTGPTVTETQITIKTRDFEGDKADANYNNIDTRPGTLSDAHEYNLYNQGWQVTVRDDGGNNVDAITEWDSQRTDFPSMADIWWLYKNTSGNFDVAAEVNRHGLGNTPAPKGHFILNEFDTDRVTLSGVATVTERDSGGRRPSTVSFFASRLWFSGVTAQEYNQKIYFSQIIDSTEQFGKCYQQNDPTSSEVSDLLPTDGGVIIIPDIGQVIKLFPMANSLIVFGTNGVWSVGGSEGVGFKTTDYAIRKISSVESLSALSFVDVYGTPIWWNSDGIFTVGGSELPGNEAVSSLSDATISTFLLNIPSESKPYVKGAFNPRSKIVQWVFRSTAPVEIEDRYIYDRILNFNLLSKAFYPWTVGQSATSPLIHGVIVTRGPSTQPAFIEIVDESDVLVVDSSGDSVVVLEFTEIAASFSFRYFTTDTTGVATEFDATWSQTLLDTYVDWTEEAENIDYDSYFFTGFKVHGDAMRKTENNYLTVFMDTAETSSCFVQAVWDYSNSASSARWTNPQQVYASKLLRDVQQTRKKIRGNGRAVHFKFYSEAGKPFDIHGWSSWETQNANV
jgi:hypothetical protein